MARQGRSVFAGGEGSIKMPRKGVKGLRNKRKKKQRLAREARQREIDSLQSSRESRDEEYLNEYQDFNDGRR